MKTTLVALPKSVWFLLATAGLVAGFYYLKVLDYEQLHYRCDLFSMLESTRSWLRGAPLLHETRYGDPARMHNFYILLLFAPATLLWGAKGLFIVHAAVLWLVSTAAVWMFRRVGKTAELFLLLALLYWGPYGFWIWMNPDMGWHIETFYLPFGVLFALALCTGRRIPLVLAGIVLVITREDGPILACCLHLMYFYLTYVEPNPDRRPWVPRLVPALKIVALWGGLFLLELALLAYRNGNQPVRSTQVLLHLQGVPLAEVLKFSAATLGAGLVVWSPVLVLAGLWFGWRRAAVLALLGAPLVFVMFWAGLIYYPFKEYSVSWNPRMALIWGHGVGCLVLMAYTQPAFARSLAPIRLWGTLALVLAMQFLALARHRGFYPFRLAAQLVRQAQQPEPDHVRALHQLAARIPRSAYVALDYYFYAPFEWHRYIWLETKHFKNSPVAQPDVVIAAGPRLIKPTFDPLSWSLIDSTQYHRQRVGDVYVLTRPGYALDLRGIAR